ncbi:hypothetical protein XELAEV_18024845mg [Xenopus laevis]|uniref:Uncharacterized protein n=1 Tax=Xenopus laevis TaxID=8355 RepID=A0A974HLA6_XENLA|nr:hypothetical protein XELAEV_18024845mg [Xenopus laevis]
MQFYFSVKEKLENVLLDYIESIDEVEKNGAPDVNEILHLPDILRERVQARYLKFKEALQNWRIKGSNEVSKYFTSIKSDDNEDSSTEPETTMNPISDQVVSEKNIESQQDLGIRAIATQMQRIIKMHHMLGKKYFEIFRDQVTYEIEHGGSEAGRQLKIMQLYDDFNEAMDEAKKAASPDPSQLEDLPRKLKSKGSKEVEKYLAHMKTRHIA